MKSLPSAARTLPGKRSSRPSSAAGAAGSRLRAASVPPLRASSSSSRTARARLSRSASPASLRAMRPCASMSTSVGHARTAYWRQMRRSLSMTTGWRRPWRSIALRTVEGSFSVVNLAEWTPSTTNGSLANRSSSCRSTGSRCMQLIQQVVQKSRRTTCPRRSSSRGGRSMPSHASPPSSSGAFRRSLMRGLIPRAHRPYFRSTLARCG